MKMFPFIELTDQEINVACLYSSKRSVKCTITNKLIARQIQVCAKAAYQCYECMWAAS